MKQTLSVVITAYNEELNIKACLESLGDLADEIIVVDNSSVDKTEEIAKKYTKKVYKQKNDPSKIDIQKNYGFSKATGDWILSLDADERLTPDLSKEIKSVISGDSSLVGYWIPRKNIIFKKWIQSEMWWPDYQLRLFKKDFGKYDKNSVHKVITVSGETGKLTNPFVHENYISVDQYLLKLINYTTIEADMLIDQGYTFNWLDSVRFPTNDFLKTFFLQKGYQDGLHGLVLSILQAFYMEVVFVKVWQKNKFIEVKGPGFFAETLKEFKNSLRHSKYWATTVEIDKTKNPIKKIGLKVLRKAASDSAS
ncbi:MAG TPA: glycosyltransferase family 2 protein [Patescibacteria group bacterium]|nr:glycosyltransferase family 2 protein [Patescibacteria group bacterium]